MKKVEGIARRSPLWMCLALGGAFGRERVQDGLRELWKLRALISAGRGAK